MNSQIGEDMIMSVGWGPCHYFIVGLCSMCTMAEATASLTILTGMTLLACDLNYSKRDVMILNAVSSLGMAFGSLIFGLLADYNGRKNLIPTSMIVIYCGCIGLAFSQTYFLISLSIFAFGVGAAGNNVTLRVYLIECLPAKKRGTCVAFIDLTWFIGCIFALAVSWSLAPSIIRMLGNEFRPSSWRVLVGLAGTPNLIMACATCLLQPSPRYLIYRRRPEQALTVLQQMFAINNSQHIANFPLMNLNICSSFGDDETSTDNFVDGIKLAILKTWQRIACIFSLDFIRNTLLLSIIRLCLFPGFIWLVFWKTYLFTHQITSGGSNSILNTNQTCNDNDGGMAMSFLHNCHVNDTHFGYLLIFLSSFVIGEGLLALGVDIIGRRLSLVASGLIGATAIVTLAFANRHHTKIVLAIFYLASYSIVNTTTNIIQLESYPTAVRGTIVGMTSILPHLTLFLIKLFVQIVCIKNFVHFGFGLLIAVATIAAMPIPDFTKIPMQE